VSDRALHGGKGGWPESWPVHLGTEVAPRRLGALDLALIPCGVALPAPADLVTSAELAVLSAEERARAARLVHPVARAQFVRCRAALRRIAGRHVGLPPEAVDIATSPNGKPFLVGAASGLHVSVAHSGTLGVIVWSEAAPVGVDVEQIREIPQWKGIARRVFSSAEVEALLALAGAEVPRAFLLRWTALEARAKASGLGLARWLERHGGAGAPRAAGADLIELELPRGFVGAAICG
jgi:phosphopantetheinyl transferase